MWSKELENRLDVCPICSSKSYLIHSPMSGMWSALCVKNKRPYYESRCAQIDFYYHDVERLINVWNKRTLKESNIQCDCWKDGGSAKSNNCPHC